MNKNAFLFQGVGSNLEKAVSVFNPEERVLFDKLCYSASEIAGINISDYFTDKNSMSQLDRYFAEWIITGLCDITVFESFKNAGINPDYIVGYSLGLNNAVYCSGSIDFDGTIQILTGIVAEIGEIMYSNEKYDMGVVIGLEYDVVNEIISLCSSRDKVTVASENNKNMIVITGLYDEVENVLRRCIQEGAVKAMSLHVPVAFHCGIATPDAPYYIKAVESISYRDSKVPVISAYDHRELRTAEDILNEQRRNFVNPMRWKNTIEHLEKIGVRNFYDMSTLGASKKASSLMFKDSSFKTIKSLRSL